MLFPFFDKRQLKIVTLATDSELFLVFKFSQPRTKLLKYERTFYARVYYGFIDIYNIYNNIGEWLESITEDYLLEILEDYPANSRPVITIHPRIRLDFNITEEEVLSLITSNTFSYNSEIS